MTKCSTPVTFYASFLPHKSVPMLDYVRTLTDNDPAFVCVSLNEIVNDPEDKSITRSLRGMIRSLGEQAYLIPGKASIRALIEYLEAYERRTGTKIIHAFIPDLMLSPEHADLAVKAFERCELVAIGDLSEKESASESELSLREAANAFEALTGSVIRLSSVHAPALHMDRFLERTILRKEIAANWRERCGEKSEAVYQLLHPGTVAAARSCSSEKNIKKALDHSRGHVWHDHTATATVSA